MRGELEAPLKTKRKRLEPLRSCNQAMEESQEATSSVNFDEQQVKQEPPESSSSPGPAPGSAEEEESPDSQQVVLCPLCATCLPNIAQFVAHMTVAHGGAAAAAAAAAASFGPGSSLLDLPGATNRLLGAASLPPYLANPFLMGQNLCLLCGGLVTSLDSAMLHLMNHYIQSKTVHACNQCSLQCHSAEELARHNYTKHSVEVFKCTLCGDILNSKEEREKHFRKRHLNEKQVGVCVFCPQEPLADAKEAYRHLYAKHLMAYYDKYGDVLRPQAEAEPREELPKVAEPLPEKPQSPLKSLDLSPHSKSPVWSAGAVTNAAAVSPPALPGHAVSKLLNLFKEESTRRCSMCHKVFEDEMSVLRHQMQAHRTEETASAAAAAAVAASGASALTSVAVAAAAVAAAAAASSSDASCSTTEANGAASEAGKAAPGAWHTQYKCSYCEESFKRPLELERHVRVHFSSQEAKCNICDELFPSAKVLQQHKRQQHQRCPPQLEAEAIVSSSRPLLQQYQAVAARLLETNFEKEAPAKEPATCPLCEAAFDSAFQLDVHLIGHKEHARAKPSPPPAAASGGGGGARPVRDSPIFRVAPGKPGQDGKYVCQICDRSFSDEGALRRHREEHISSLVQKARSATSQESPPAAERLGAEEGRAEAEGGAERASGAHHYKCVRCKRIFKSWKEHFIHRKSKKCKIKL